MHRRKICKLILEYFTFYKLQNLTNAKFEFNSLLGLVGQIRLLVLHPKRIKKQNGITNGKLYNIPDQLTCKVTTLKGMGTLNTSNKCSRCNDGSLF